MSSSSTREPLLPCTPPAIDLGPTFRHFQQRKLMRRLRGYYSPGVAAPCWMLAYVSALGIALASAAARVELFGQQLCAGPAEWLIATTLCAVTLGTTTRTIHANVFWRWASFWAYLGGLIVIVTHDFSQGPRTTAQSAASKESHAAVSSSSRDDVRWHAAVVLAALEVATLAACYVVGHVLPAIALSIMGRVEVRWLWQLQRVACERSLDAQHALLAPHTTTTVMRVDHENGIATNRRGIGLCAGERPTPLAMAPTVAYEYRLRLCGGCASSQAAARVCSYRGGVSSAGLPHGYGEWTVRLDPLAVAPHLTDTSRRTRSTRWAACARRCAGVCGPSMPCPPQWHTQRDPIPSHAHAPRCASTAPGLSRDVLPRWRRTTPTTASDWWGSGATAPPMALSRRVSLAPATPSSACASRMRPLTTIARTPPRSPRDGALAPRCALGRVRSNARSLVTTFAASHT